MKAPLVVANWKMYVEKPDEASKFVALLRKQSRAYSKVKVVVAPAFTLLPAVASALKGSSIALGAQTLSANADAKHTGDVSALMLKAAGVSFVIVGHSERRAAGESDETVRAQIVNAHAAGLTTVVCVGEKEQDASGAHFAEIARQISSALAASGAKNKTTKLVIAYEPLWAIGKAAGDAMQPAALQETVIFIRKTLADILGRPQALRVSIIYGGSVEPANAQLLLKEGGVAGFLVGHASAKAESFIEILKATH